jgi:serine phosphatase RsbU (regulator of sigma subunit)
LGRTIEIPTLIPGPLLGFGGKPAYPERSLTVENDDMVVMFTDGLVESRGETLDDGIHRLVAQIEELPRDLDQLCDRLIADRLEEDPQDDIALLAVEVTGER